MTTLTKLNPDVTLAVNLVGKWQGDVYHTTAGDLRDALKECKGDKFSSECANQCDRVMHGGRHSYTLKSGNLLVFPGNGRGFPSYHIKKLAHVLDKSEAVTLEFNHNLDHIIIKTDVSTTTIRGRNDFSVTDIFTVALSPKPEPIQEPPTPRKESNPMNEQITPTKEIKTVAVLVPYLVNPERDWTWVYFQDYPTDDVVTRLRELKAYHSSKRGNAFFIKAVVEPEIIRQAIEGS